MKFSALEIHPALLEAINYMGFETLTPIQEQAIPAIFQQHDLLACAQTGTGKTVAFVLPILNQLACKTSKTTDTLIIVPTRELAIQIEQQIQGLSYFVSVSSIAIYGGGDGKEWETQKEALINGADIIVATPGKLLSHLQMGYVNFNHVSHFILDEADRMLDMGFIDDIKLINSYLPEKKQTLLFSATMPASIRQLSKTLLHQAIEISIAVSKPAEGVTQSVYLVFDNQKDKLIHHLLEERKTYESIIIFTSSKLKINQIVYALKQNGYQAQGISSNLSQDKREEVLQNFKSKNLRILVATDVLSRGIDVKDINLVINYDVPFDAEDYVHRVGRTARASNKGEAITLVNPNEMFNFSKIENLIGVTISRAPVHKMFGEVPVWNPIKIKNPRSVNKTFSAEHKKNRHNKTNHPKHKA